MNCHITNEVNRMLSEQEAHDAAYERAVTEVEMEFFYTHEAQEVYNEYVASRSGKSGFIYDALELSKKLASYEIDASSLSIDVLTVIDSCDLPGHQIAKQEIRDRILKAAHQYGYIDRMVQERM